MNKKKIIQVSFLITLLFIFLFVFISSLNKHNNLESIDGTIISIDNDYVNIISANDSIYRLIIDDDSFKIGDDITIYYKGEINLNDYLLDIDIKKIKKGLINRFDNKTIDDILSAMTIEEKVGQLLLVRVPENNKYDVIKDYHIGGYILFGRDTDNKTKTQIQIDTNSYQKVANIPLIIAIDEEGGKVSRLNNTKFVTNKFKSPQDLFKIGGYDEILHDAKKKTDLLHDLGINVNLAPVADVATDKNAYIYARTFGSNAKDTAKYIETVMNAQTNGVSYVLKHFPGYGNNLDTHEDIVVDNRAVSEFFNNDFLPFKAGIDNGALAIMMSHNIVSCFDDVPSSISKKTHNILRNELDFNGIIITDDLAMKGISNYDIDKIYVEAVLAGNNMLIVTDYKTAYNQILEAVNDKVINEELINILVYKVLYFKYLKKLIY